MRKIDKETIYIHIDLAMLGAKTKTKLGALSTKLDFFCNPGRSNLFGARFFLLFF